MSELHDVLNASLAVNQQLSAEVDALRKYAKNQRSFSQDALAKVTDALIDGGFLKSASKDAYMKMCSENPDKVLESLQKIASSVVQPNTEKVGTVVQKSASWFSTSNEPKEDPYKDCFQRY